MVKVGIIGGSGLDNPDILKDASELEVVTPYGKPSAPLALGRIGGVEVAILARHGRKHQFSPSQVNYRANIHALKAQGVTHIIATSACGSLREEIGRGDLIIIDQFIDFTRHRKSTFFDSFENGAAHTAMADPFDAGLRQKLFDTSTALGYKTHDKGTMITIEGPRFSTRAESNMFRLWGADVINMSVAPEAILANEAGIPYAVVAMSTDYDCWKEDEAPVTWEEILEVFNHNADNVKNLLLQVIPTID
jgi:5'-methylthioadenosine phosphorylase